MKKLRMDIYKHFMLLVYAQAFTVYLSHKIHTANPEIPGIWFLVCMIAVYTLIMGVIPCLFLDYVHEYQDSVGFLVAGFAVMHIFFGMVLNFIVRNQQGDTAFVQFLVFYSVVFGSVLTVVSYYFHHWLLLKMSLSGIFCSTYRHLLRMKFLAYNLMEHSPTSAYKAYDKIDNLCSLLDSGIKPSKQFEEAICKAHIQLILLYRCMPFIEIDGYKKIMRTSFTDIVDQLDACYQNEINSYAQHHFNLMTTSFNQVLENYNQQA